MKYDPKAPVVILAPHLDDAVLSCFAQLVRDDVRARVLTIFAGVPKSAPASRWDELCGFEGAFARDVMNARRAEDADALDGLAEWLHFDFLDNQYRLMTGQPKPSHIRVGSEILRYTRSASLILAPATISPTPHPDHALVTHTAISICRPAKVPLALYADVPHALKCGFWPGLEFSFEPEPPPAYWSKCLAGLPVAAEEPEWAILPTDVRELKAERMRRYASQFRGLTTALRDPGRGVLKKPDIYGVECSWRVEGTQP